MSYSSRGPESGSHWYLDGQRQQNAKAEAAAEKAAPDEQTPGREAVRRAAKKSSKQGQDAKRRTARKGQSASRQSRRADPPSMSTSSYREFEAPPSGPPGMDRLLGNERRRADALAANEHGAAASALRDVVADLDFILATTATYVSRIGTRASRKSFQDAFPQLITVRQLTALPFDEVAEFLDLPAPEMDDLFGRLVRNGGFIRTDRDQMLRDIRALRKELQTVAITRNHSLLNRLVRFILGIGQAVGIATVAGPIGALAAGEPAMSEAIVTGVSSLVGIALHEAVRSVRLQQAERNHAAIATKAHTDLLAELGKAGGLATPPAYEGEAAVRRFRLAVRCARARVASLPLQWEHKGLYWSELDDIQRALETAQYDTFDAILGRLETLPPAG